MSFELEDRVDRLEALLGRFIVQTEMAINEIRREGRRMSRQWGELANKMGTLVEDIVAPNIPRIAKEYFRCEDIEFLGVRILKRNQKDRTRHREFDVIAVCDDKIILNETKSTPRQSYIEEFVEFLEKKEFFDYFPEYEGKEIIPVFASLYMQENTVSYLSNKGIYAMAIREDTMDLINFENISEGT
ncbi:MAG: hypothetical protein ACK415_10035 [Thermodesulfovibrionales bacterium]